MLDRSGGINIFACPNPLSAKHIDRIVRPGGNLIELIEQGGLDRYLLSAPDMIIYVDDRRIAREDWLTCKPTDGQVITIRAIPGGGGGKNPLRIILTLAVLAFSLWIPGLGIFAEGAVLAGWGGVAGAAVAIGGGLLVNALIPTQQPKFENPSVGRVPTYGITGMRNQAVPYSPSVKVYGKHRIYPRYAALPYTEPVGSEQYLRCLFDVGYAPLELSAHKIGETLIDDLQEVDIEEYQSGEYISREVGDDFFSIFPFDVYEDSLSIHLTQAAGWQQRTTQTDTDEISFDLTFPSGLFEIDEDDGDRHNASVQFQFQYSESGLSQWIDFEDMQKLKLFPNSQNALTVGMTVVGQTSGAIGTIIYIHRIQFIWIDFIDFIRVSLTSGQFQDSEDVLIDATYTESVATAALINVTINARHEKLYRYNWKLRVERDQYDVRWRRITADNRDNFFDDAYITALRSIRFEAPITKKGRCLVAMRIKASGQLNGVIDQYNCIAEAHLPVWSGSAWQLQKTRSPAWAFADVFRGPANKRPLADSRLNLQALIDWDSRCTTAGFKFDGVVDFKSTVFETARDMAASCRASLGMIDDQYTVVEDIAQSVPVNHFTPRNSWGFRGRRLFVDIPHCLKIRFINENTDYIQDEMAVCDDGFYFEDAVATTWQASTAYSERDYVEPTTPNGFYYRCITAGTSGTGEPSWPTTIRQTVSDGSAEWICETPATRFETIDYWGVVDPDHVWKMGRYHLAVARLRPEIFEFNTDVENIVCTRGDLIKLSHDAMLVGLGQGRVKSLVLDGSNNVTQATFDDVFPMEVAKTYQCRFRLQDGKTVLADVVTDAGEQYTVDFLPVIPAADAPAVGDLALFGETSLEAIDAIVTRIDPGSDLSARITCVNAAPAVLNADTGLIPAHQTGITQPPASNRIPAAPVITDKGYAYHYISKKDDGSYRIICKVGFEPQANFEVQVQEISGFEAQYKEASGEWIDLAILGKNTREFNFEVQDGNTYNFRIRAFTSPGLYSDWAADSIAVAITATAPPDVTGLQVKGGGLQFDAPDCEFEWTAVAGGGANGPLVDWYKIEIRKIDDTLLRSEFIGDAFYSYTFNKNAQDNAGSPLNNFKINVWAYNRWEKLSLNAATITVTNPAPGAVTSLAGSAFTGGVRFIWDENSEVDFSHYLYRSKVETDAFGAWQKITQGDLWRSLTPTEKEDHGTGATIYIEVKAVDTFGNESGVSAVNQVAGLLNIKPTDIDDFAITASKIFTKIPILYADTWTDNSPATDRIAWNAHKLYYDGVEYSIAAGNTPLTTHRYVYWKDKASIYSTSIGHPADDLGDWTPGEDFIIAVNESGAHQLAWNAIANQVIGSAYIKDLAVSNAKISDLDGSKITASSIVLVDKGSDYDLDNIPEGIINKYFTTTEETKLTGIENGADVTGDHEADIALANLGEKNTNSLVQVTNYKLVSDNEKTGAGRGYNGLNSNNRPNKSARSSDMSESVITGTSLVALSSSGMYGFDSGSATAFYLKTDGTFKVGKSNDYMEFNGTNLKLSTSLSDALVIKSGGDIKLESGGDIKLESTTGGGSALIQFQGNSRTYYMGVDFDNDRLELYPDTANVGDLYIGYDISGTLKKLRSINLFCEYSFELEVEDSSLDYRTAIEMQAPGSSTTRMFLIAYKSPYTTALRLYTASGQNISSEGNFYPYSDSTFTLGLNTNCWSNIYGDAGVTSCSDKRFKSNIRVEELGLDFILSLQPIQFEFRKDKKPSKNGTYRGFLAQDVEAALAEVEYQGNFAGIEINSGHYGLNYEQLLAPIVKAIQESYINSIKHVEKINERISKIESKID